MAMTIIIARNTIPTCAPLGWFEFLGSGFQKLDRALTIFNHLLKLANSNWRPFSGAFSAANRYAIQQDIKKLFSVGVSRQTFKLVSIIPKRHHQSWRQNAVPDKTVRSSNDIVIIQIRACNR